MPLSLVRGMLARTGRIGQEEAAELAELASVPDRFVAWWLADLEQRGMLLPPEYR